MVARDYRAVLARLRQLLAEQGSRMLANRPAGPARRATLAEASRDLSVPRSTLHDLAVRHNLPRRRRSISPEQARILERELKRAKLGIRQLAKLIGLAASTVSMHSRRRIDGDRRAKLTFRPRGVKRARICPKHGKLNLWPCVACAAEAAKPRHHFPGND